MKNINTISHKNINKSNLYFTRKEFSKILNYYSLGVAKGNWRDYSIDFTKYEAYFHFYKNTSEKPSISIIKNKNKKNNFRVYYGLREPLFSNKLENLFSYINRKNIKLIKR